jgi:hypothetical protein
MRITRYCCESTAGLLDIKTTTFMYRRELCSETIRDKGCYVPLLLQGGMGPMATTQLKDYLRDSKISDDEKHQLVDGLVKLSLGNDLTKLVELLVLDQKILYAAKEHLQEREQQLDLTSYDFAQTMLEDEDVQNALEEAIQSEREINTLLMLQNPDLLEEVRTLLKEEAPHLNLNEGFGIELLKDKDVRNVIEETNSDNLQSRGLDRWGESFT